MEEDVELSVSIVNTNHCDLLRDCVKSIYEGTTRTRFEVIVVDNASTDGSAEMIRREFPAVHLIVNAERLGYGRSHNRGIRVAKGKYVLILNEDMVVFPHALDIMVETIGRDAEVGVLGCRLLKEDGTVQASCSRFPTLKAYAFEALVPARLALAASDQRALMYSWEHDEAREVDVVTGACMLVPRKVLDEAGPFDPQFFIYAEETDLCKRIRSCGYKVLFTPDAQMLHLGDQTTRTMSAKMHVTMIDSKCKYLRKHHSATSVSAFRMVTGVREVIRLIGWLGYWVVAPGTRKEQAKQGLEMYSKGLGFVLGWTRP